MGGGRGGPLDDGTPPERHQVWPRYRMGHAINTAWLAYGATSAQMHALEDAWDRLVVVEAWRDWVRAHRTPASPFLYLAVRDGLPGRRLRKTRSGASLQLPVEELDRAEAEGTLVTVLVGVIVDLHVRWAEGHGHPLPPDPPPSTATSG